MAIALVTSSGARTYNSIFPNTENPISESSNWVGAGTVGLDWNDIRTTGGAPGRAYGQQDGAGGLDDSVSHVLGAWENDQAVEAIVSIIGAIGEFAEVELWLRGAISANSLQGYGCCFSINRNYFNVGRWNGDFNDVTTIIQNVTIPELSDGDVLKATIVKGIIRAYINGDEIYAIADPTYTSGKPGIGHFLEGSGTPANWGFKSFAASEYSSQLNGADKNASGSISAAFPKNVTSGNKVIVTCVSYEHTPATTDLSSSGTATIGAWVRDHNRPGSAGVQGLAIFSAPVTGSGTLTVTFNPGVTGKQMSVSEYSGVTVSSYLGVTGSNNGTGAAHTSGSIANTAGSLLIYVASELSMDNQARVCSDNVIHQQDQGQDNETGVGQYKITNSTPNTLTDTFGTSSVDWYAIYAEYKAAATEVTLAVNNGGHALASDAPVLTQVHNLSVNAGNHASSSVSPVLIEHKTLATVNSAHALTSDAPSLIEHKTLAVAAGLHSLSSESINLVEHKTLQVADASHALISDALSLTEHKILEIADSGHALSSDMPVLTEHKILEIQNSSHALTSDALVLDVSAELDIADSAHVLTSDAPALTQAHNLAAADSNHSVTSDNIGLASEGVLSPTDALHNQTAESPIPVEHKLLTTQDSAHATASENADLTEHKILEISDASHLSISDNVLLAAEGILSISDAVHALTSDSLNLVQIHNLIINAAAHALTSGEPTLTEIGLGLGIILDPAIESVTPRLIFGSVTPIRMFTSVTPRRTIHNAPPS